MVFTVETKQAIYNNRTLANSAWSTTVPVSLPTYKDDGVFVCGGSGAYTEYSPPGRGRNTSSNGRSRGIINMLGTSIDKRYGMSIAIDMYGGTVRSGLLINEDTYSATWYNGSNKNGPYVVLGRPEIAPNSVTIAHKVEVMKTGRYHVPGGGSESYYHIHAMGFTTILYGNSQEKLGYASWLFAPMVDVDDNDGYPNISTSGYPYITNSTVVFNDKGVCMPSLGKGGVNQFYVVPGTNVTSVSDTISTAMSDSVLESNTGILAVACMVSGDGYARWVGYKNGVYKVYQGSKPLYGMPGERMTIKGHEFVCLAYGPFYARLS